MADLLYIQYYYYLLISFLLLMVSVSLFSYGKSNSWKSISNSLLILFGAFTTYYLGTRGVDIGIDTSNYKYSFQIQEKLDSFAIRKDPLYDLLTYIFSHFFNFKIFLTFCAFIYVFGALYGFKMIFKEQYYLPALIFFISPYFFQFGINVMRNGMAASLFLIGVGKYYKNAKFRKAFVWFLISIFIHLSMLLPLAVLLITKWIKNTKVIFTFWLLSILLALFNINILVGIISYFDIIAVRFSGYTTTNSETSSWPNLLIFGILPVLFAVYCVIVKNYKDSFYIRLLNTYMLVHIPYIILINSTYALRVAYLAEFLMPLLLLYPVLVNPIIRAKFRRLSISTLILVVFLVKAYKILII